MSVVQIAPQASLEIENRWDDAHAARLSPAELLLYRSNLLGSDKRITNFGGGNTSAKVREKDPLTGEEVEVLWVKGSGGDLGTMKLDASRRFTCRSSGRSRNSTVLLHRGAPTSTPSWCRCIRIAPST